MNLKYKLDNLIYKYLFIILYISLLVGFYFNENTLGGSYLDYQTQKEISKKFSENFLYTLLHFDNERTRHSPVLISILSIFEKFTINDEITRLISLHFLLLIIYFFYRCLKLKFPNYNSKNIYFISLLIFLSPTFRSLSIWPDSRLYGILFLTISIYYYLKFLKEKKSKEKFKFAISNTIYLCIASYFSPNFSLFAIFFLYYFFKYFNFTKYTCLIIFLNLILSLPAIYYVFFLKIYFFLAPVTEYSQKLIALNPANKILLISSIFLYHFIPFLFISKNKILLDKKILFIILTIFLCSIYFFNYEYNFTGGGIFYKLSNIIFKNNYSLYFFALIGLMLIFNLLHDNLNNLLLIIIIFLGNPQLEIYHKYYDPMLLILLFTLFKIKFYNNFSKKNVLTFYSFSFLFLIVNLFK